jgi:uncharacterized protein YndB with AHSA1/START domain
MTTSLPEHAAAASLVANPPHWTLRLQRTFPQDRNAVWHAITDPDALAQWTPIRPDRALSSTGPVRLTAVDGSDEVHDSQVRSVTAPESLTYLWGDDQLRFSVFEESDGTLLTLAHTMDDHNAAASTAAGWHLCLGALELLLDGQDVPSVVGENAKAFGWDELERAYRRLFDEQTDASNPDDQTDEDE